MSKKPVLVVMAAGMGSRYGGLKQIDPVGNCGEAILDFSIYDAHEAGFETIVIIIKDAIKKDFMEMVDTRLQKAPVEIRYAYQELDKLPEGYTVPEGRTKPWGTSHAVLCAKDAIDGAPFAVINADDYYGKSAYKVMYDALCKLQDDDKFNYCMVGYEVGKTVSDYGGVTRGICQADGKGYLTKIVETSGIEKYEGGIRIPYGNGWQDLDEKTLVSMNMWGFMPSFLEEIGNHFPLFLEYALRENPLKGEFLLPTFVDELVSQKRITMKVLSSPDRWFGVTYSADKPMVMASLREMTENGKYPDGLWK